MILLLQLRFYRTLFLGYKCLTVWIGGEPVMEISKGYNCLLQEGKDLVGNQTEFPYQSLWKVQLPRRIVLFIWKLCHQGLPLKQILQREISLTIRLAHTTACILNQLLTSSFNVNLYQQCDLAQICALDQFKNTLRMSRIGSNLASLKQLNQEEFDKQLTIPICLTLYANWCIRNKVVFENHMPNPMEAINLVRVSERQNDSISTTS